MGGIKLHIQWRSQSPKKTKIKLKKQRQQNNNKNIFFFLQNNQNTHITAYGSYCEAEGSPVTNCYRRNLLFYLILLNDLLHCWIRAFYLSIPSLLTYWIFPCSFMDCWASFCLTSGVQWLTLCCAGTHPWRDTKPGLNSPSSVQWRPDQAKQKPPLWTELGDSQQRIQNMAGFSSTLKELVYIKYPNWHRGEKNYLITWFRLTIHPDRWH